MNSLFTMRMPEPIFGYLAKNCEGFDRKFSYIRCMSLGRSRRVMFEPMLNSLTSLI